MKRYFAWIFALGTSLTMISAYANDDVASIEEKVTSDIAENTEDIVSVTDSEIEQVEE